MEPELFNETSYEATVFPSLLAGETVYTVIVKATFRVFGQIKVETGEAQLPLEGADLYCGDPLKTAVRYESDFVPFKPRADVLCVGKAYAQGGVQTAGCIIRFGVGSWRKTIFVVGDRHWEKSFAGLSSRISEPEPFESIEVSFENAYGGFGAGKSEQNVLYEPNPIGKGFCQNGKCLAGLPLPNLEDPRRMVRRWQDRLVPMSYGPVGRTWQPRIQRAGTYDNRWLEHRSPALPTDFNDAYYNCAPMDQQFEGYLRGNEVVRVENMHPEYPRLRCSLPGVRIRSSIDLKTREGSRLEEISMNLDTLWIDMEALNMVLVWRGRISAAGPDVALPLLIVEEPLDIVPHSPESYRYILAQFEADEEDTESESEEAAREIDATDEVTADVNATSAMELPESGAAGTVV